MEHLKIEEVEKKYAHHLALDSVSLGIEKGSVFGLLGPNGAGKTTLIRIINQITAPDKGRIFLNGLPLKADDIQRIGYLPEERGLYKKMKVGEQALYLAQLKGLKKNEAKEKLKYWFKKFDIIDWWDKKVEELSKGMQQKTQFITTILHDPELLIFDEPFSGFDPINAELLKKEILSLKEKGATIIFSTHNMASVEEICDNIALINKGKTILNGEVSAIKSQFRTHIYEVAFSGENGFAKEELSHDIEALDLVKGSGQTKLLFKNKGEKSSNELLSQFIKLGKIRSFNEQIPSIHEIFIQVVNQSNTSHE